MLLTSPMISDCIFLTSIRTGSVARVVVTRSGTGSVARVVVTRSGTGVAVAVGSGHSLKVVAESDPHDEVDIIVKKGDLRGLLIGVTLDASPPIGEGKGVGLVIGPRSSSNEVKDDGKMVEGDIVKSTGLEAKRFDPDSVSMNEAGSTVVDSTVWKVLPISEEASAAVGIGSLEEVCMTKEEV